VPTLRLKELTRKNVRSAVGVFLCQKIRGGRMRHIDCDLKLIGEMQYKTLMVAVPRGNSPWRIISRTSAVTIKESLLKEHVILGIDALDIQRQKDRWLAENPRFRITETSDIKREPPSLLIRLGGKSVPRFSMILRYREEDEV
jgi:hypothetical protein